MSRKDYRLIAAVFRALSEVQNAEAREMHRALVRALALELKKQNPRFNSYIFSAACGVPAGEWKP